MPNQEKLNQVIIAFEHWRKARINKHLNIPEELRHQAIGLCTGQYLRIILSDRSDKAP